MRKSSLVILFLIFCSSILNAQDKVVVEPPPPMELSDEMEVGDEYILEDGELKKVDPLEKAVVEIEEEYVTEAYDKSDEAADEDYVFVEDKSLRTIDDDEWEKLKKDSRFQYSKVEEKKEKKKERESKDWNLNWLNSGFFEIFLYFLVGAFIVFILFSFFKNNDISFRRKKKVVEEEDAPWEDVEHFEDWELALNKAIADGDYRIACRILFLQSLQQLNNSNLIEYKTDRTNWHYVQKLLGTEYHEPFRKLTAYFDYVWYGQYEIKKEQFERLRGQFSEFKSMISA